MCEAAPSRPLDDKCQFLTITVKRTQDTEIKDGVKTNWNKNRSLLRLLCNLRRITSPQHQLKIIQFNLLTCELVIVFIVGSHNIIS